MKSKGKLFKRFSRKVSIFSTVMLILQPLLMVGITPAKTFAAIPVHALGIADHVVISELYVDAYDDNGSEFVELYNPTGTPVDISGWKIKTDLSASDATLPDGAEIEPNGYYLIVDEEWDDEKDDDTWPDADHYEDIALANSDAGVSLIDGSEGVVDAIGHGDIAGISGGYEGTPQGEILEGESYERKANAASTAISMAIGGVDYAKGNGWDTDNNANDFVTKTEAEPQNSSDNEDIIAPQAPDVSKITVDQNSPGTNDKIIGTAGAVEGETDVVVYKDAALLIPVVAETSAVDGAFDFSILDNQADVNNKIYVTSRDANGNESEAVELINDITSPTASLVAEPVLGNATTPKIKFTVTTDEEWPITIPSGRKGTVWNGVNQIGADFNFLLVDGTTDKYSAEFDLSVLTDADKNVELTVKAEVKDNAGNQSAPSAIFQIDNVAPGKVTDLKAVAGDGKVDLSWANPTDADLANIQIIRNGTVLATLAKTVTTYSDTAVTNGTAYTYDVYAIDTAGNRSEKVSVNVTPVAPVVTAVAASEVTSAITTETIKPADEGEIKAEVKEAEEEEPKKDTEVKEDKKIPVWGILFLLILAAIGGYLFYVQNPERFSSLNGKK